MKLDDLAEDTVRELAKAFSVDLDAAQLAAASKALNRMLAATVDHASDSLHEAAISCCEPGSAVGDRISGEMERTRNALIANLSSLR